ncbi:prealbumin-like fold domain-containing protein [Peptococcus niger]|uniref:Cna protein B-type domain-containing protein n=1 Tax=Peptococcus niger TaxID=2741 RepID=A0A1G6VXF7_PEPNI|nr:prealbumin-like fold domain-containing protein [Peptococcus niger]SDD58312.1 Cna protein B-type domain-containing protein [Peptococcus niger]
MPSKKNFSAVVLVVMLGLAPIFSISAQAGEATISHESSEVSVEQDASQSDKSVNQDKAAVVEMSANELRGKLDKTLAYYTTATKSEFSPVEKESLKKAATVIEEEISTGSRKDLTACRDTVRVLSGKEQYATLVAYRELLSGMKDPVPEQYEKITDEQYSKESAGDRHETSANKEGNEMTSQPKDVQETDKKDENKPAQEKQGIKEGTIVLTRTDKEGYVIKGAEITIWDKDNKEVFKELTDDKGRVYFSPGVAGTYTYQETKPAEGYVKDDKKYTVSIDADFNVAGETTTATDAKQDGFQTVAGQINSGSSGGAASGNGSGFFGNGDSVPQTGLTDKAKVFGAISAVLIALSGAFYAIYNKYAKRNICRGFRF